MAGHTSEPPSRTSVPPPAPRRAPGRSVDRIFGGELGGTVALAALYGSATAVVVWGALLGLGQATSLVWGGSAWEASALAPWWVRLFAPAAGGLACGLLIRFLSPGSSGLDVPELIDDIGRRGGRVDLRRAAVKTIASIVSIGAGGSAGPEGPLTHAGGAVASGGSRLLGFEGQRAKVLVACGAAAAMGAIFGTPLAGTLFAVEVVLGAVHMRALLPVAVAAALGSVVRSALAGAVGLALPTFLVPETAVAFGARDVLLCLVLGVLGGVVGGVFGRSVSLLGEVFTALPVPSWTAPAIGGLLVGAMGFVMPGIIGHGYGSLPEISAAAPAAIALTASFVAWKLIASSITLGSGGAGGIVVPALAIGGALGAAFGALVVEHLGVHGIATSDGLTATFAVVGAAAVLAGSTHAALTATAFVFELTMDPGLILPALLAAGSAVVVATLLFKETVHTLSLRRYGGKARRPPGESSVLHETSVAALVTADADKVRRSEPLSHLVRRVVEGGAMYQHVVDENGKLLGTVSLHEVGPLLREDGVEGLLLAYDVMRAPPVSVTRNETLSTCLERFGKVDFDELPVVDGAGVLVGRVTRRDVLAFYAREVLADKGTGMMKFITRTDPAATAAGGGPGGGEPDAPPSEMVTDFVEVPPDHQVEAMPVPPGFIGHTLKDLNLRARFGVGVISMRRRTPGGGRISLVAPDPNVPLRDGDVLVLAGPKEQVAKLMKLVGMNAT